MGRAIGDERVAAELGEPLDGVPALPRPTTFQNVDDRVAAGVSRSVLTAALRFAAAAEAATSPSLASWTRSHRA